MTIFRNIIILASIAVLSACSSNLNKMSEVDALGSAQSVGSPFTQQLAQEYRNFVNSEFDTMKDHADALHFSRKGLAAARGDTVMPEQISDWNLTAGHIQELSTARARLVDVFDLGARELMPDVSAIAQARFDCWIEQQEENFQPNDIISCKNQFIEALQKLEAAIPAAPPPAPAPVEEPFDVDANAPMKAENAVYLVFFDFDSATLTSGANGILDSVAQEVNGRQIHILNAVGHTDTSGSKTYNRRLSLKRANAVRDGLIARGVDANLINVDSRGESELMVDTADGVREPANRRVEITFQ